MPVREGSKNVRPKRRPRKRFLEVDVWRPVFGPVSVKAIYDVYCQKFNVDMRNKSRYSFQHCVNALRKLEDPDYISPDYGTRI